jgi:uncharacterized protein YbjT (DUF2867 family)
VNVIVFGGTGMVGAGVLIECLEDPRVRSVLVIGRRSVGISNPKLRELIRSDFFDYRDVRGELSGYEACFFCLGVSVVGMSEPDYQRLTYELTTATADAVMAASPEITFCYVSAEGADSTERGRSMWARIRGKTENHLLRLSAKCFVFRPGYIQPMKGVRSKTRLYQTLYDIFGWLYPVLRRVVPKHVTTTENVGRAMIEVAAAGYSRRVLENADINFLAAKTDGSYP